MREQNTQDVHVGSSSGVEVTARRMALPPLHWAFLPEWAAWWLLLPSGERGFGPFNETEAKWAAEVHKTPFPASPQG